jgi:hypothetical protein
MAHWNKIEDAKNAEQEEKKKQETEQLKAVQLQQQKEREEKAKQRAYANPRFLLTLCSVTAAARLLTLVGAVRWCVSCRWSCRVVCCTCVRHRAEHQLSKEERLKRRELLERYGYQIETTDEHGDIVLTENLCDVQDTAGAAFSRSLLRPSAAELV